MKWREVAKSVYAPPACSMRKILASEHLKPGRFNFFDADPFVRVAPGPPMDRVIDALPGLEAFGREATLQVDL